MSAPPIQTGFQAPEITVAITVYDRRRYIVEAVESALGQTRPVRVMVVEDCGPDPGLKQLVCSRFGDRIEYVRSPSRRGLFDNWNACLEAARTPWLSILHDDDYLKPDFSERLAKLIVQAPGRGLYFGNFSVIDENGAPTPYWKPEIRSPWEDIDLIALAEANTLGFPGQLLDVEKARGLGGFRRTSQFCGDWEMWFRMVAEHRGARCPEVVTCVRLHHHPGRGTSRVERQGRSTGLTMIQRKRNLAELRRRGLTQPGSLGEWRRRFSPGLEFLLNHSAGFGPRFLTYNAGAFCRGSGGGAATRLTRLGVWALGPRLLPQLSRIWRRTHGLVEDPR